MDFFKKVFKKKASVGHKLSDFDQNYFVGKVLGKGGFAVVKEVIRKSDSTKYAAKIIDKSRIKSEEENIKSEIEVLKKIKHQHIISMVDIYQTNTQYYLVMDLATGGELFDRIFALGQYTEKDASRVIHQLLLALEYLHDEVNIVHRDLKPENLLYKDPAADADILLTDFGLSRVVGTAEFLQSSCGTPHYVAPEVLQESGHGKPVDMWATGVSIIMLTSLLHFIVWLHSVLGRRR